MNAKNERALNGDNELTGQIDALRQGDRRALAKTITLIESTRNDHRRQAAGIVQSLLPDTGRAIRLGISGVPGVGKSTFIEALGLYLIEQGYKLAVLAVDPSSQRTGGSIMGDKTRMERLSQRLEAFIRPSPTSGALGGVAAQTRETMLLCEAAGYDVILVETVGVGQSETMVAGMVDCFALLQLPNAGDDLQAIKKGIMEIADLIAINKADINPEATQLAIAQFRSGLHLLQPSAPGWTTPVIPCSGLKNDGIIEFWQQVTNFRQLVTDNGELHNRRQRQAVEWFWSIIDSGLRQLLERNNDQKLKLQETVKAVAAGERSPVNAAHSLLEQFD
ncbi:MAG: methylmalonyl Co-A mutase-associated GTPase MeaB [Immundisolibacteraceae bacterium]|nr:methylmalonyl Co-A mutase-associated GTPase MeaB [Immundisolibacteraceae bacterium]